MSRARSFASVSAAALALLLTACSPEAPPAPPPPEVTIVTVRSQAVPNVIELPGRVQAVRTSEVRARVDGIVERRLFNEGSFVRAGTALFRIDPRQLTANANAARAQLSRAPATAANVPIVGEYIRLALECQVLFIRRDPTPHVELLLEIMQCALLMGVGEKT